MVTICVGITRLQTGRSSHSERNAHLLLRTGNGTLDAPSSYQTRIPEFLKLNLVTVRLKNTGQEVSSRDFEKNNHCGDLFSDSRRRDVGYASQGDGA